jgi:SAM-dependent methyltransferase
MPTTSMPVPPHTDAELLRTNRRFYDALWADARLIRPQRFNTWPLVHSLLPLGRERLEVAPGLRPRLPLDGTHFIDISAAALARLHESGASVAQALITSIPFPDRTFDLVCALDVVEHVDDEDGALSELSRVAVPGATLLLSVPLHPLRWTAFDELAGHRRRYEPKRILAKLSEHDIAVERSAVFGMQPRSSRLVDAGIWWLTHHREFAMWWYNRLFMPLALRFQSTLAFVPGMVEAEDVDEALLLCRKV